jgi:type II secretory pathway component PulK
MNRQRGIALPIVLWGIAFLAAVVIMVGVRVKERTTEQSHAERSFHARTLALKGLAFGRHPGIKEGDPLLREGDPETEGYEVLISDESGRINPNTWIGDRDLFSTLFFAWDVPQREADAAIDSLTDWIDADEFRSLAGAERGEYESAGLPGFPPNAPLGDIREMESVLNLRDVLAEVDGWKDDFTILYDGKINVNHASEALLADLAGLEERQILALKEYRQGVDGERGTEDDLEFTKIEDAIAIAGAAGNQAVALEKFFGTSGKARRVESTGFAYGVSRTITVVTQGDGNTILAWEEK